MTYKNDKLLTSSYGMNKLVKCYLTERGLDRCVQYYKDIEQRLKSDGYKIDLSKEYEIIKNTSSIVKPLWIIMKIFGGDVMQAGQSDFIELLDFDWTVYLEDDLLESKKLLAGKQYNFNVIISGYKKRSFFDIITFRKKEKATVIYGKDDNNTDDEWEFIAKAVTQFRNEGYVEEYITRPTETQTTYLL